MCGIVGFWQNHQSHRTDDMHHIIQNMAEALFHRGPDDKGCWVDGEMGLAFGHMRLSILDISEQGHQPMESHNSRYVIAYNGEIYNFLELRDILKKKGCSFKGKSDTEVILVAIEEWGLEKAVRSFDGMFSFALWDKAEKSLHLCRDRIGEKPLYYGWHQNTFFFSSELKALSRHPLFSPAINLDALSLYVRLNYIPTPLSIYQSINKLVPGTIFSLLGSQNRTKTTTYWSPYEVVTESLNDQVKSSEDEVVERLDDTLRRSVKSRMVSDVPLGAFLSGGIDSSTIVALMQVQNTNPVKTFTVGFFEEDYNEADYARKIASHLGTDHTELFVTEKEAMDVIPRLPELYDEPFADSSQIPTLLISQLAHSKVTVSLSGDGGDEIFGGYNRHIWNHSYWGRIVRWPISVRRLITKTGKILPISVLDNIYKKLEFLIPTELRISYPGDKINKFLSILNLDNSYQLYERLINETSGTNLIQFERSNSSLMENKLDVWSHFSNSTEAMMYLDLITYLPDDILVKVDRASMGASLESRAPFLDHKVVEFAWKIPLEMKIRNGQGKWILRKLLYNYVPENLFDRPKTGFGVPIEKWLKTSLRGWAESLIEGSKLLSDGFFNPNIVQGMWNEHLNGTRNRQHVMWNILMFQAWFENQRSTLQ
tara:strand:- start:229 stop:2190 length:1962 start_codon:yes stop_codon:yes gene_type:complete